MITTRYFQVGVASNTIYATYRVFAITADVAKHRAIANAQSDHGGDFEVEYVEDIT